MSEKEKIEAEKKARKELGLNDGKINGMALEESQYMVECKLGPDSNNNYLT